MSNRNLKTGDLVVFTRVGWEGMVGIVSQPIEEDSPGHVLVHKDGCILGVTASTRDVLSADRSCEGFAQLAYNLIKLGSHVIEQRLI